MNNKDLNQFLNKIEDLIWEYDKEKKGLEKSLRKLRSDINSSTSELHGSQTSKRSMVGFLPSLLQDKGFFKSNQEIIDFSNEALNIPISAARKRSRNELIGLIVCKVEEADNERMANINKFLSNIVDDNVVYQEIKSVKREKNISWTDLIRDMS